MCSAIASRDASRRSTSAWSASARLAALVGQQVEACGALRSIRRSVQAAMSSAPTGSGAKSGNVGPARQRALQFAGAAADLPHALQIGRQLRAFLGRGRRRQHALIVDEAAEIGAGDRPGVALVLDEAMRDGERAALLAFDQFDRAEQVGTFW